VTARGFAKAVEVAPGASVLARFSAERPWILEKATGQGKVVLMTTSATPADSDLPLTPLFLPLLHRLARYLAAPDPSGRTVLAGEAISLPLEPVFAGGEAHAIGPSGARLPMRIALEAGEVRATLDDTAAAGSTRSTSRARTAGRGLPSLRGEQYWKYNGALRASRAGRRQAAGGPRTAPSRSGSSGSSERGLAERRVTPLALGALAQR
jgi:hypothetical protein